MNERKPCVCHTDWLLITEAEVGGRSPTETKHANTLGIGRALWGISTSRGAYLTSYICSRRNWWR